MIIHRLKPRKFENLYKALMEKAYAEPLDASYTVNLKISGAEYSVRLQPEARCRMAVLQALRIERDEDGPDFELITESAVLSALLELLLSQWVK